MADKVLDVGEIDKLVGGQIRDRRVTMGLRQEDLAEAVGVGRQQITKYENGISSLSTDRLVAVAEALDVSVSFLLSPISPSYAREHRLLARFRSVTVKRRGELLRAFEAAVSGVQL